MSNLFKELTLLNSSGLRIAVKIEVPIGTLIIDDFMEPGTEETFSIKKEYVQSVFIQAGKNVPDHGADLTLNVENSLKPTKAYIESVNIKYTGDLTGNASLILDKNLEEG